MKVAYTVKSVNLSDDGAKAKHIQISFNPAPSDKRYEGSNPVWLDFVGFHGGNHGRAYLTLEETQQVADMLQDFLDETNVEILEKAAAAANAGAA